MIEKKILCALGADHRGFNLKEFIKNNRDLQRFITFIDVGTTSDERTDYPIFAHNALHSILEGESECAILLCGTGIGMAIAANRYPNQYAGVVWCPEVARRAKEEDNVTILVLPADYLDASCAVACIQAWIKASFKHDRYQQRLLMLEKSGAI